MTTSSINKWEINGVIDTSNGVWDNINTISSAVSTFVTWDSSLGKWAIIVNGPDTSVKSFDDSNIVGEINVTGSGINDLYNSVEIEYPHKDLKDGLDYVTLSIPTSERYEKELDNTLQIKLDCINNPIQAQILAAIELKQNRLDKVIEFNTDFTSVGLKAGDVIDITSEQYDFDAKLFRIVSVEEQDAIDDSILIKITAIEYDDAVYDTSGLIYEYRTKNTFIPPRLANEELDTLDDVDLGVNVGRLLAANAALGLINSFFNVDPLTGKIFNAANFADADKQEIMESLSRPGTNLSGSGDYQSSICAGNSATVNFSYDCNECLYNGTQFSYDYTISGVDAADVDVPLTGSVDVSDSGGSLVIPTNQSAAGKTMTVTAGGNSTSFTITDCSVNPLPGTPGGPAVPTRCEYTSVPVVWCGQYDGDTGELIGVSVLKSANFAVPQAGEATVSVPKTVSVSGGTITIDETVDVASSSSLGGIPHNVITSFNSVAANGLITGTTTTVYGY